MSERKDRKPKKRVRDENEAPRSKESKDLLYGIHTLEELLASEPDKIEEIWVAQGAQGKLARLAKEAADEGLLVRYRPRPFFQKLVGDVNHQGVAIRRENFLFASLEELLAKPDEGPLVFMLGIQDPGNMGAILRSARAFGAAGAIITERQGCGITPVVHKTSVGATSELPIARVRKVPVAIRKMKDAGWWLIGLAGEGRDEVDRFSFPHPTVLLLGSEGPGLSDPVKKKCDALLRIPMVEGWDSLNVSASGAIALYEWQRQSRSES